MDNAKCITSTKIGKLPAKLVLVSENQIGRYKIILACNKSHVSRYVLVRSPKIILAMAKSIRSCGIGFPDCKMKKTRHRQ